MPAITGLCIPGRIIVYINKAELLEDIYVKHNAYFTKHPVLRNFLSFLGRESILVMDTFHKDYANTRKVLASAFFAKKLVSITKIIKEEIISVIKECQQKGPQEVNIFEFWANTQCKIFTSIAFGKESHALMCTYENEDGSIDNVYIGHAIRRLILASYQRMRKPHHGAFPELMKYAIFADDRRYRRNVQSFRDAM